MGLCTKTLSLNPLITQESMDAADYNSAAGEILGVSGGRAFRASAVDGSIIARADYSQLAWGRATIAYDGGINKAFAAAWNTPHFDPPNFGAKRLLYRLNPNFTDSTNVLDASFDIYSTFGMPAPSAVMTSGISKMRNYGGIVYCLAWATSLKPEAYVLRFQASNILINGFNQVNTFSQGYPNFAFGSVAGQDAQYMFSQDNDAIEVFDWITTGQTNSGPDTTKSCLDLELDVPTNRLFVTDEFQLIYVYNATTLALTNTINTARSSFNGVSIQKNPLDPARTLYIAGGADNTVFTLNPTTLALSAAKTGFDLPCGFVNVGPNTVFAVQQGSVPLKLVV